MRFFNTAGPVNPADHYHLDPLARIDRDEVLSLIQQKKYFVLHAPRQTGKTTCLKSLMGHLNALGTYHCLYVNWEAGQGYREQVVPAMVALTQEIALRAAQELQDLGPAQIRERMLSHGPENATVGGLAAFSTAAVLLAGLAGSLALTLFRREPTL